MNTVSSRLWASTPDVYKRQGPLKTADNVMMFKQIVRAIATRSGSHASFLPKPLPDQAGSGLHINLSLYMDGRNLFEGDIAPRCV